MARKDTKMIDEYYVCVVTKEKGTMYAGRELTLVRNKENGLRFRHEAAVRVCRELKEMKQSQALTVVSANALIHYENGAAQSPEESKPRKNEPDAVQSPRPLPAGGIEAIDVIDEAVADPASFYRGNAIKYLLRAGKKGDAKQDLEKARYYIDREINHQHESQ